MASPSTCGEYCPVSGNFCYYILRGGELPFYFTDNISMKMNTDLSILFNWCFITSTLTGYDIATHLLGVLASVWRFLLLILERGGNISKRMRPCIIRRCPLILSVKTWAEV